jgi:hypothetical protein
MKCRNVLAPRGSPELDDLPDDIVMHILKFTSPDELRALRHTSRKFKKMAESLMHGCAVRKCDVPRCQNKYCEHPKAWDKIDVATRAIYAPGAAIIDSLNFLRLDDPYFVKMYDAITPRRKLSVMVTILIELKLNVKSLLSIFSRARVLEDGDGCCALVFTITPDDVLAEFFRCWTLGEHDAKFAHYMHRTRVSFACIARIMKILYESYPIRIDGRDDRKASHLFSMRGLELAVNANPSSWDMVDIHAALNARTFETDKRMGFKP